MRVGSDYLFGLFLEQGVLGVSFSLAFRIEG
jgi:hypothetical protein